MADLPDEKGNAFDLGRIDGLAGKAMVDRQSRVSGRWAVTPDVIWDQFGVVD